MVYVTLFCAVFGASRMFAMGETGFAIKEIDYKATLGHDPYVGASSMIAMVKVGSSAIKDILEYDTYVEELKRQHKRAFRSYLKEAVKRYIDRSLSRGDEDQARFVSILIGTRDQFPLLSLKTTREMISELMSPDRVMEVRRKMIAKIEKRRLCRYLRRRIREEHPDSCQHGEQFVSFLTKSTKKQFPLLPPETIDDRVDGAMSRFLEWDCHYRLLPRLLNGPN